MSNKSDYLNLTSFEDYPIIAGVFTLMFEGFYEEYLKKLLKSDIGRPIRFDRLDEYQIFRIDFCINIRDSLKDIYINLISKADIPKRFKVKQHYDLKSKRTKPYPCCYQVENNSVSINFYDKSYQLSKLDEDDQNDMCADEIIRFEVQCKYLKVYNMCKKKDIKRKLYNLSKEELSQEQVLSYYKKTIGIEDYYSFKSARDLINESNYSNEIKESMINILKLIAQKRNVWKARESEEIDSEDFNKAIKKIKKLGINPVTIPNHFGIPFLPNLIEKIEQEFISANAKITQRM